MEIFIEGARLILAVLFLWALYMGAYAVFSIVGLLECIWRIKHDRQ